MFSNLQVSTLLDFDVWPRPKILNRYFENAIASLDLNGKEDLKYCMSIKNAPLLPDSSKVSAHQVIAAISFSKINFGHSTLKVKHARKHSINDCQQLFALILG